MMLQSLYTWRIAWNSLPISIFFFFFEFLEFVLLFLYFRGSFVYFMYTRVELLCPFNEFALLIRKKILYLSN
jgi:hypothetical protein